jgi:pilus assembly protein CpaB
MDARKLILLVGALVVAAITAFMARSLMVGAPAPQAGAVPPAVQAAQNVTEVLVATRELPPGTILDPEMVKFIPWPNEMIEGTYYKKDGTDIKALQGTVVRFSIPAGQPMTQGSLVKPGDRGFLAAALTPGMRAVTVKLDGERATVAGFVFPGDRVDLLLTQEITGGGDGPPLKATETVMRNVRILATDQRTDKQTDDKGNTVVTNYSTVTVEATPKIAEKLAVMSTVGTLSLSLRSLADNQGELEEAIANGEVKVPEGNDPKAEKAMIAQVASRPTESGGGTVTTGADVSRFQRSTVPGKPKESRGDVGPTQTYPGAPAAAPTGPMVTIARGNSVTVVPVGGKN